MSENNGGFGFFKETKQSLLGANTDATLRAGYRPYNFDTKAKRRDVILTDKGWVRRTNHNSVHGGVRQKDEILVAAHPGGGSNSYASAAHAGGPDICDIFLGSNTATGNSNFVVGEDFEIKVVFNEPVAHVGAVAPRLKLVLANTVAGNNALTANALADNSNTGIEGANNTIVFKCKPTQGEDQGTYKIGSQTIVKLGSGTANLASLNSNRITANLVINAAVSNSLASFTIANTD
jgi:hypothetical protein